MLCGVRKAGWDPASQLQSPTSSPLIVNLDFTSIHLHYSIATWLQRLPKRLQAQKMMTQRPGPGPAPNEYRGIKRSQQACLNCRYAPPSNSSHCEVFKPLKNFDRCMCVEADPHIGARRRSALVNAQFAVSVEGSIKCASGPESRLIRQIRKVRMKLQIEI